MIWLSRYSGRGRPMAVRSLLNSRKALRQVTPMSFEMRSAEMLSLSEETQEVAQNHLTSGSFVACNSWLRSCSKWGHGTPFGQRRLAKCFRHLSSVSQRCCHS